MEEYAVLKRRLPQLEEEWMRLAEDISRLESELP
jgi:hypothetical protein